MKIFIVGSDNINKLDYANELIALNDNLNICKYFTSESKFDGMLGEYKFNLSVEDIDLSFKNDVLLFIDYQDEYITGVTHEDFYNSDILNLSIEYFNLIPDQYLNCDNLIVWIDNKSNANKKALAEANYFLERVEEINIPLLYFINEDKKDIAKIVIDYIEGDEKCRKEILAEHN